MVSRKSNPSLFFLLLASVLGTAVAVLTAIFIAGKRPTVVVVPMAQPVSPTAAVVERTAPQTLEPQPQTQPEPAEVVAIRLPDAPGLDPFDPVWDKSAAAVEIDLQPQQTAEPMLRQATVQTIHLQAAHDGRRIAWRLAWEDPEPDYHVDVSTQSDAVAIQLPMEEGAPFTMGGPDLPVRLLYWRALWQQDIDEGFQDITQRYPHAWSDLYWFADGKPPYRLPEDFQDERSHQWLIPYRAGNPLADFLRERSVEELVAEGFGTSTHVPQTPSHARGAWRNGWWTVVIDRPLDSSDPLGQRLAEGQVRAISLAVWDGGAGNAGGRKHWCPWVPFRLER